MSTITAEHTVGELVAEQPGRSRVFEAHRIDYCCGGKRPLAEACEKKGVAVEAILEELAQADQQGLADDPTDYSTMALDALADHIVDTHHAYLGRELPRLLAMAEKVAKVHGDKDARLAEVAAVMRGLAEELEAHMMKEERVLFPGIRMLVQSDGLPAMPCGTLAHPISVMEAEHDDAGNALEALVRLTDGYTPPDWACNTYRALLDGLADLELDLHQHIHKENNILFPRAIAEEQRRTEA
ncbi:MAG: iron-sulfur cluster repair di-iron protein [Candidatus Hydrogenedentes bacterium]|nr:iron-sulfur cluster repair di-iron protein [Candidatus Hydrogenedentota bacterium]